MRTIALIFGLLCAVGAHGQIYLNSYAFGGAPVSGLLLDDYPNAAAAYSLRQLRSLYTGNCIQVRRASDNGLQDIGFSGGVLDTAALKTHCAGTNCFVTIWYDQAGGGFNATQTTAANQPKIVASGNLYYENGKPAINLSYQFMSLDSALTGLPQNSFSFYGALKTNPDPNTIAACVGFGGTESFVFYPNITQTTTGARVFWRTSPNNTQQESPSVSINNTNILYSFNYTIGGGNYIISRNGTTVLTRSTSGVMTSTPTTAQIGAINGTQGYIGLFQEFVFYASDNRTDRAGIESNINGFYSIY